MSSIEWSDNNHSQWAGINQEKGIFCDYTRLISGTSLLHHICPDSLPNDIHHNLPSNTSSLKVRKAPRNNSTRHGNNENLFPMSHRSQRPWLGHSSFNLSGNNNPSKSSAALTDDECLVKEKISKFVRDEMTSLCHYVPAHLRHYLFIRSPLQRQLEYKSKLVRYILSHQLHLAAHFTQIRDSFLLYDEVRR